MDEAQFKKLALWQERAAQIGCSFARYDAALELFGEDNNFMVCPDGSVGFIDHSKAMTFAEATGRPDSDTRSHFQQRYGVRSL